MKTSKVCFAIGMRNWITAIWTLELKNLRTRSVTGICSIGTAVYANAGALDNAKALRTAASQTGSQWDALALRGAPPELLDSSRRDSNYGVGPPSVVDPANTCRPSARVTFLPLAIFEPSLAR